VAFLVRWIMDTRPFAKGVVTANTAPQLRTKTWAELAKWHNMAITRHWWSITTGQGSLAYYHKDFRETWRVDGQTCKEENSEAFAGQHVANSTSFYIFDEASGVPDRIYEVREGGLTDGEPMTFDFGNPTRNSGRFHSQMEGRLKHRYKKRTIDSRDVEGTNKKLFQQWADDYGEDSDFFKVRVRGLFPDQGSLQLIPTSAVLNCMGMDVRVSPHDPMVMGVDVARFGDDRSVIQLRQGRDATVGGDPGNPGQYVFHKVDTMTLAAKVVEVAQKHNPDAVFIDGGGVGGGVIDRCRQLGLNVIEINFGSKATDPRYANMRAQMWCNLRDALEDGIRIPDNDDLRTDLTSLEYGFNTRNQIQLESKEDAKARGLASPDLADALALTYALPVVADRGSYDGTAQNQSDYDPMEEA
jgi:hypothetical protein